MCHSTPLKCSASPKKKKEFLSSCHHTPLPPHPFPRRSLLIYVLLMPRSGLSSCKWPSAAGSHSIISEPQPQNDQHLSLCGNWLTSRITQQISKYRLLKVNQKWLFWHSQEGRTGMGSINRYFLCSPRPSGLKTSDLIKWFDSCLGFVWLFFFNNQL